jgi:endonuclease YncB( thermonuclease family)
MILTRFGFAAGLAIPAAAFGGGLAVGALLLTERARLPVTANAAIATPAIAASPSSPASAASPRYPVEVLHVVDGDTFEARVRAWPGVEIATKVRLRDVDAPELRARCAHETALAHAARDALAAVLDEGTVSIGHVSLDKYGGRVLADAATAATSDVASALLAGGHVRLYAGRQRQSWCDR